MKLLDRELMGLASRAVVLLILAQFFLLSKSLKALGQGDGLGGGLPAGDHALMLLPASLLGGEVAEVEGGGVPVYGEE